MAKCGWTCNKPTHGILILTMAFSMPFLLIVMIALKYNKLNC